MGVIPDALDLPPGSQPWKRSVDQRLESLSAAAERSAQDTGNMLMSLANTVKLLGDQVNALPVVHTYGAKTTKFAINGTYKAYAAFTFRVPTGKPRAQVFVSVNGAVLDTISGGVTRAYGRINFGGVNSVDFPSAKDAGASAVNNVISGNYFYNVGLIPGAYYTISFEMYGTNPSAFPAQAQNFAAISAIVVHSNT